MSGKRILDPKTVRADVSPRTVSSVGSYAVTIAWNDGHGSGIYSFEHLRSLGDAAKGRATYDV
jgi:ATP-binding protein involved in chromosome partitioning